jgi:tetratricopeptide (TPR) repeat protein
VAEGEQALKCNPFSVRISQHLGYSLYCARNYDEAIQQYQRASQLDPHDASVYESLADAYERKGQQREAVGQWKKAATLAADAELTATLRAADAKGGYLPAMSFAREHLRLGDKEQALRWLKLACEERNVYSLMIGSDPFYDPLRTDQRFAKLLLRMKLDRQLFGGRSPCCTTPQQAIVTVLVPTVLNNPA